MLRRCCWPSAVPISPVHSEGTPPAPHEPVGNHDRTPMSTLHGAIPPARVVRRHPGAFARRVRRAFRANQALRLAGGLLHPAVAGASSHSRGHRPLARPRYRARTRDAGGLPGLRGARGSAGLDGGAADLPRPPGGGGRPAAGDLVFFSALAFTVLENAMSVVFQHRVRSADVTSGCPRRCHISSCSCWGPVSFLLLGAQVIAEYERRAFEPLAADPPPLRTPALPG